jgi:hypothetical protein
LKGDYQRKSGCEVSLALMMRSLARKGGRRVELAGQGRLVPNAT